MPAGAASQPLSQPPQAATESLPAAADGTAGYTQTTLCNIEFIDEAPLGGDVVRVTAPARLRGWLGDEGGVAPARPMLVLADVRGTVVSEHPLQVNQPRPDVVQAFPDQRGLENSGFELRLDPRGLAHGTYHLYLTYDSGQRHFLCDNGRHVQL